MQKEQQQQWVDERIRSGDMVLESILKAIWTIEHSDQEV